MCVDWVDNHPTTRTLGCALRLEPVGIFQLLPTARKSRHLFDQRVRTPAAGREVRDSVDHNRTTEDV
jgi:hypothetical protein